MARVYQRDASAYNYPSHNDKRPTKYHWPQGDGVSSCGRSTIQDDDEGVDPNTVPVVLQCAASGCRDKFAPYTGGPYWLHDCGCREYKGDLDAPHTIHCDRHSAGL